MMDFSDKTAVITGSGRGLGKKIAASFAESGGTVVITARSQEEIDNTAKEINNKTNGKAYSIQADISNEKDVTNLVKQTIKQFGQVDFLINNAALHQAQPILETDLATWQKILDVNLTGTFLCAREFGKEMKKQSFGKIINISSTAADTYFPGFGAYSASKAGLEGLALVLQEELKKFNIDVLNLKLGLVNTAHTRQRIEDGNPKDWIQPDQLADIIKYFCTKQADIISGTTIDIKGRRE